tara:strand:+ start:61 stop:642 length:582 start_codon:yes stop_codon:yes gene_type:complete
LRYLILSVLFFISIFAHVGCNRNLNQELLDEALECFNDNRELIKNKRYLVIIDYNKDIFQKRFWLYDIEKDIILMNNKVTHALKSGIFYCNETSNVIGSNKSSVGSFITGKPYYGKWGYSMKVHGLDKENDRAYLRNIVFHSQCKHKYYGITLPAWLSIYSKGCFCFDEKNMNKFISLTKNGTFVYVRSNKKY